MRMRRFLLMVHRVPPDGEFTLNDLAGGAGRMDEVASVVGSCFLLSNGLRRETELTLVIRTDPARPRRVRLVGTRLKYLNPDERSTAALLKNALSRSWLRPSIEIESTPGIFVGPVDPLEEIRAFAKLPGALWLTEGGTPLRSAPLGPEVAAILSDPDDPRPDEADLLRTTGIPQISVGPRSLRASEIPVLLHNELDLREAARPGSPPVSIGPGAMTPRPVSG